MANEISEISKNAQSQKFGFAIRLKNDQKNKYVAAANC